MGWQRGPTIQTYRKVTTFGEVIRGIFGLIVVLFGLLLVIGLISG